MSTSLIVSRKGTTGPSRTVQRLRQPKKKIVAVPRKRLAGRIRIDLLEGVAVEKREPTTFIAQYGTKEALIEAIVPD